MPSDDGVFLWPRGRGSDQVLPAGVAGEVARGQILFCDHFTMLSDWEDLTFLMEMVRAGF